jgi:hypothetical protein
MILYLVTCIRKPNLRTPQKRLKRLLAALKAVSSDISVSLRCEAMANPINAVVVRQWDGKDYGPWGKTVFLTNGSVDKLLQPFDDDDDRGLIESCCIKSTKQQCDLDHPPRNTSGPCGCMWCSR